MRSGLHHWRLGFVLVRALALTLLCTLLAQPAAHAVCLNPFGCGPKSYADCMRDASDKPTDAGVKLASQQCYLTIKKPEEDKAAAALETKAVRFAVSWHQNIAEAKNSADLIRHFGGPTAVDGPYQCTPVAGKQSPPSVTCARYEWADRRTGKVCSSGPYRVEAQCVFRAEVILDGPKSLSVWAWWPESN